MKMKTTVRYHPMLVRMAIIKYLQITNVREGVEKSEPSYTVGGNVSSCSHMKNSMDVSQKTIQIDNIYKYIIQQSHSWTYIQTKL